MNLNAMSWMKLLAASVEAQVRVDRVVVRGQAASPLLFYMGHGVRVHRAQVARMTLACLGLFP